ncbi:hypothetical protein [Epilithonimonas sp. UC225_85]|uniref:hypothetical protein n=1 Tax=Epilithonimonas sp. UC225_85 TaxID=3350167 RepID=UPI0036D2BA27
MIWKVRLLNLYECIFRCLEYHKNIFGAKDQTGPAGSIFTRWDGMSMGGQEQQNTAFNALIAADGLLTVGASSAMSCTTVETSGAGSGVGKANVLDVNEVHFMQSSIKNSTGDFTVLGNAEALKYGTLNPEVLTINVWKDETGKVWTLDHRRLAAFKLEGSYNFINNSF